MARGAGCCGAGGTAFGGSVHACLEAIEAMPAAPEATQQALTAQLVPLKGGFFDMGARKSTYAADQDAPRLRVRLRPFMISPTAVSNADFSAFVQATGYITLAEREGWSFVFHMLLDKPARWPHSPPGLPWWRKVEGACWSAPEGPETTTEGREDHPAVHIAWYDALAYCAWAGLRLPSEAEWEYAARGGLARTKFPWGNALRPGGLCAMNTWQGEFPVINTAEDGFIGTAPVRSFAPNGYGLFNMTGNVWEWVGDRFGARTGYQPAPGASWGDLDSGLARVQRGGSYLCHESYCDRYHVHSRTKNDPDSSTGNCGFRVAANSILTE